MHHLFRSKKYKGKNEGRIQFGDCAGACFNLDASLYYLITLMKMEKEKGR
jgi:hypothetical protein